MIDRTEAARRLIAARANHEPIPRLPRSCRPLTDEDAYAIQDEITKVLGPVGGWKVGQGAADAHPTFAPIYRNTIRRDGAVLAAADLPRRRVEVEIGFVLAGDWTPGAGAWRLRFAPVIEIVHDRFETPASTPHAERLADAFGNAGAVVGEPVGLPDMADLAGGTVMVRIDEGDVTPVSTRHPTTDPLRLALWLCDERLRRGQPPRTGDFITTGALLGPVRAEHGVSADWGRYGTLAISFR
jgi:2-keto-4-pentenoate hydratase